MELTPLSAVFMELKLIVYRAVILAIQETIAMVIFTSANRVTRLFVSILPHIVLISALMKARFNGVAMDIMGVG